MRLLSLCRHRGLLVAVLAAVLGLTSASCDDLTPRYGGSVTTGVVDTTSTEVSSTDTLPVTTTPPTSPPTTEALSSAEERMPGGHIRAMGYIHDVGVDGDGKHLSIDYAEMLTNRDEATAAARAAGDIGPTEEWDLDFYISNVNPKLREFDISDSVDITTSTRWVSGEQMGAPCTWADFLSFFGPGPFPESEGHLHEVPWWIERDGNTIVRIDEQYLP